MKLGFVSAILDGWTFEEMMQVASDMGFSCVEVACWPQGKAERRYAGVSHIDVTKEDREYVEHIREVCRNTGVEISALAFYPNTMDEDPDRREAAVSHLKKVIRFASLLGVGTVTTFIGRAQHRCVEDNLELVKEVWPPIIRHAEECGVRIAIENCPMLFGPDQWPGGQNLFTSPELWRRILEILPSPSLGINYDPSHFVWQMMDYISPLSEFRDRIFHVHYKDIRVDRKKLERVGTLAYPLDYMTPKLPGLGDVDWGRYVSALEEIGYEGYTCIEIEDKEFEGSRSRILESLRISKEYIEKFMGSSH